MGKIKEALQIGEEIKNHLSHIFGDQKEIQDFDILEFCSTRRLSPEKAHQLITSQTDREILWSLIRKNDAPSFMQWCNEPVYRSPGDLGFQTRVKALFPEYTDFLVFDSTGNSVAPPGKFFTAEEVYDLYCSLQLFIPAPGSIDVTDVRI